MTLTAPPWIIPDSHSDSFIYAELKLSRSWDKTGVPMNDYCPPIREKNDFNIYTVNPLYTYIWYNDKTCYNDNLNGTNT